MNVPDQRTLVCGGCGKPRVEPSTSHSGKIAPCPECGSTVRTYHLHLTAYVRLYAALDMRCKKMGVGGWRVRQFVGWQLRKSVGDFVRKVRRIDRVNNRYLERVETADGTVLRDADEALSAHQGHGTAKGPASK